MRKTSIAGAKPPASEGEGNLDLAGDPAAWRTSATSSAPSGGGDLPGIDQTLSRPLTLRDHLLAQLSVDIADPVDRVIGAHLIDMLDDAGYLQGDLADVASRLDCEVARVEATLAQLQRFDPPGIFARDLAECLALQLKERNRFDPAMQALLANLPLLAGRDAPALMRALRRRRRGSRRDGRRDQGARSQARPCLR